MLHHIVILKKLFLFDPDTVERVRAVNIVFMGTPEFAIPSLTALIASDSTLAGVVTQPDRPKGRGKKLTPSPVKNLALKHGVSLMQPEKVREQECLQWLKALKPDLIVVVAFGQILPPAVLAIPAYGCINLHASLLPCYRGAAPINWALINGEGKTGVTTIVMNEGMDTGDILLQRETPIAGDDDSLSLGGPLSVMGAQLLLETISQLKKKTLTPKPQNHSHASYAPPLKKEHGLIDWNRSAQDIHNQIRGTLPWPVAFTHFEHKLLKILRSAVSEGTAQAPPGTISRSGPGGIEVVTGKGYLTLTEVQLENRSTMSAAQFVRGHAIAAGSRLG